MSLLILFRACLVLFTFFKFFDLSTLRAYWLFNVASAEKKIFIFIIKIQNYRLLISNQAYIDAFAAIKYDSSKAMRCIMHLQKSSLHNQLVARDAVVYALRVSLDETISPSFVCVAVSIWKRLENVVPRTLCEVRLSCIVKVGLCKK